jgi:hypothetical protein
VLGSTLPAWPVVLLDGHMHGTGLPLCALCSFASCAGDGMVRLLFQHG